MHIQCERSNLDWIWIESGLKAQCERALSDNKVVVVVVLGQFTA